ncbi:hypothetical protein GGP41_001554 [Bipolaris sorokiniana]|uniref:Uncharacterized protein n=1 Tax=Cochliobolus sativus TaxID=45130 RepID=A0A8H5ZSH6_COCSA|nr:hypothetical protein GGP41_001554 [Bipolaris sorokiniana]
MLICSTFVNRTDNITELYLAFFFWIRFYYLMQRDHASETVLISYRILTMVLILVPGFRHPFLPNSYLFWHITQNQPLGLPSPEDRTLIAEIREDGFFLKFSFFYKPCAVLV